LPEQCEEPAFLYRWLTETRWPTKLLSVLNYDLPLGHHFTGQRQFLQRAGVDLDECVKRPEEFRSAREVFERQIRFWLVRPMEPDPATVVAPCDSRLLLGSLAPDSRLHIKQKLFGVRGLLGDTVWPARFEDGDFAVFRLTPELYHHNHCPVTGRVVDFFAVDGQFHSCHPRALVSVTEAYGKNRRVVTILDTDVPGGSQVGLVAMVEVVALMIGQIEQRYSTERYDDPQPVRVGDTLERGCVKSLFRPGSSTVVLLMQRGRVEFEPDLLRNRQAGVRSHFTRGLGEAAGETQVRVRMTIGRRLTERVSP
jgi:phosphatidylserine decarboxylase